MTDQEILGAAMAYTDAHGGGSGGTNNYNDLSNQPQIGGNTLIGDKSASDLGLVDAEEGKGLSTNDYDDNEKAAVAAATSAISAIKDGESIDSFSDVENALNEKQNALTAGDYIQFEGNEISVKRTLDVPLIRYEFVSGDYPKMYLKKYENEELISTNEYSFTGTVRNWNIDGFFTLYSERNSGWTPVWRIVLIKDSANPEHSAGYETSWGVQSTYDFSYSFNLTDVSGYKLVIKSELDAALATKADLTDLAPAFSASTAYTVGQYVSYDGNIYKCTSAHSAGAWVAGDFTLVAVGSELESKQNATDNSLQTTDKTVVGAINEHEGDIGSLKSGLTDLTDHVDGDATTYPYADVITINDAVPANLADCSVKIEPVQDLHGYDKPWVGGAGKNKCAQTVDGIKARNSGFTWVEKQGTAYGITVTILTDDAENVMGYSFNGTCNESFNFSFDDASYLATESITINGCPDGAPASIEVWRSGSIIGRDSGSGVTVEAGSTAIAVRIESGTSMPNVVYRPMIRLSTETDDTFAPYTNICPISGHTEAAVTREGKNLFDKDDAGIITGYALNSQTGVTYPTALWSTSNFIEIEPSTTYTLNTIQGVGNSVAFYDSEKTYISGESAFGTRTTPSNAKYLRFDYKTENLAVIQLELGSTATSYEPYAGQQYTLVLGDTIYGGTVDFKTGVMTVKRGVKTYTGEQSENWIKDSTSWNPNWEHLYYISLQSDEISNFINDTVYVLSNECEGVSRNVLKNTDKPYCVALVSAGRDLELTSESPTVADFKTYLASNPLQVCYELATPLTVQLTPEQIQLLQGTNTLYASTGDISVTVNGVSGAIGAVQEQVNELAGDVTDVQSNLLNLNGYIKSFNSAESSEKVLRIVTEYAKQPVMISIVNNGALAFGMVTAAHGFIGSGNPTVIYDSATLTIGITLSAYAGDVLLMSTRDFTYSVVNPS